MKDIFQEILCPVCKSENNNLKIIWQSTPDEFLNNYRKNYYNLKVLGINLNTIFYIMKCTKCSFVFVNPRFRKDIYDLVYNEAKVAQNDDKKWRESESDIAYLNNTFGKWSAAKFLMRSISYLQKRFDKVENKDQKRIKLLDFGCGFGHILELCKPFGINGVGVEIDRYRLEYCKRKGLKVFKPNELNKDEKFDIIISTSVLEHINDLHEYFNYIKSHLETEGYLSLTGLTPAIIKKEKKKGVYHYVMPLEHINYFTPKSFDILVKQYGLKRVKICNSFQPVIKSFDYIAPFLKNIIFHGFYPNGGMEVDLIKL
ncbi:MAG: class I SAM-dependent methyltransferase [bacterium]